MKRSFVEFLQDILDAIDEVESFTAGVDFISFQANREKILAVVKLLEIIGEAVKKIPNDKRIKYKEIPWQSIAGMRDLLVHEYWQVDGAVVYATVQESIPLLKTVILNMLNQEGLINNE
jgi:uncharacterized protein with HEPN domain